MIDRSAMHSSNLKPLLVMAAVILGLLLLGWGVFFVVVLPGHYLMGGQTVFGTGLAVTAFTLGIRHGFDPDHIAAIDNTTRKLVSENYQPVTVGFWFALGHSTVVIVTVVLLAMGLNVLAQQITVEQSTLTSVAGIWGILVSGLFLLLIGTINLLSLQAVWRLFRGMRNGQFNETELEHALQNRGVLNRILGPVARRVDRPCKMYVVGILFGLGFDTATTIALFVVGGAAALTAPWYVVLVLPVLFTAGMTLVDTLDGIIMHHAYAWAFAAPVRKIYYNLTITIISVAVAFLVGTVGLTTLVAELFHVRSGPLGWIAGLNIENLGYGIVAILLFTWLAAYGYWKIAGVETRYSRH
jgi:high-affinity nickel-transport protein